MARPAGSCAVCGSALRLHLRVAGQAGSEGLVPTTDRYGTALADIARCPACGHMQLDPMPPEAVLDSAYADAESADYVAEEGGQRKTAAAILSRMEQHVPPGEILDVGCWLGFLLAEARARGWRPHGIEPSAFAVAWAQERLGLDIQQGTLEALDPGASFDAIVLGDVLEHLPEPAEALSRLRAALNQDGVLALTLPDAGSLAARVLRGRWWSVIPTHVHYFTRASLTRLLEDNAFDVLETSTAPKAFTVRYYLSRAAGYSPRVAKGLVAAAERAGFADRLWAPDFRDRMLVLARPVDG